MNLDMGLKKWQGVEIFCREKGETAGYLEEGKIASYDFPYTMDLRAYDGIEVVVGAANRSVLSPISRNNTAYWRAAARQEIYMEFLKNPPEQGSGQPVTCSTSGMGLRLK